MQKYRLSYISEWVCLSTCILISLIYYFLMLLIIMEETRFYDYLLNIVDDIISHSRGCLFGWWKHCNPLKQGERGKKQQLKSSVGIYTNRGNSYFSATNKRCGPKKGCIFLLGWRGEWILLKERRSHSDTDKRWKWNNFLSWQKHSSSWQNNSSWVDGEGLVL